MHFAVEAGGLRLVHVAYRGGAPAALDVAAGRMDMMFANIAEVVEHDRAPGRCAASRWPPRGPRRWRPSCRC